MLQPNKNRTLYPDKSQRNQDINANILKLTSAIKAGQQNKKKLEAEESAKIDRATTYNKNTNTFNLPEITVKAKPKEKNFLEQSRDDYLKNHKDDGLFGAMLTPAQYLLGLPRQSLMYATTGKVQKPSESSLGKFQDGFMKTALDLGLDPLSYVGVGLAKNAKLLPKLNSIGESKALSNIYNSSKEAGSLKTVVPEIKNLIQTYKNRNKKLITLGAENLNQGLISKIKDLESREGFSRLVQQEREMLQRDFPNIKNLDQQASHNAQTRISELYQTALKGNVNQNYLDARKLDPTVTASQFNIPSNNAHFVPRTVTLAPSKPGTINLKKSNTSFADSFYGKETPGDIAMGREFAHSKSTVDHEINHALQNNRSTVLDNDLIKYFKSPSNVKDGIKGKGSGSATDKAYRYFLKGSKGKEPTAFLAEARKEMLENGLIKNIYEKIDERKVKQAVDYFKKNPVLNPYTGKSDHRIFDFANSNPDTMEFLAKSFNRLPVALPAVLGLGALTQQNADGGYMNNGINPKFNNYLNNGQHAFGGMLPAPSIFGQEGMNDPQETPQAKAARLRQERIDARNLAVQRQAELNRARLAPIEAAQQGRFETWRTSDINNANRTYADWQAELAKAQEGAPAWMGVDDLNIKENYKRGETKGSCSTGQANRGESLRDNHAYGGWLDKYDDSKQYAEGGEIDPPVKNKPIYVESESNPRYQAYQDSLSAYNMGNTTIKRYNEAIKRGKEKGTPLRVMPTNGSFTPYPGTNILPIAKGLASPTGTQYGSENSDVSLWTSYAKWKKPEQQVIVKNKVNTSTDPGYKSESQYKKEHPPIYVTDKNDPRINRYTEEGSQYLYRPVEKKPVRAIQNNLRPEGLVYGNTDLNSTLPTIRPSARNAKSYKVKETVQGKYGPSIVDYEVTDPRNINMNDLGPDNTRTVIPQYKYGGQIDPPGKKKFQFLQPTSDKLPEGYKIPYNTPSSERAMSIGGEDGEPAYLIPSFKYGKSLDDPMGEFKKTGEHLGGPFKTWQEADEWEKTVRHPAVEKRQTIMFPQEKFQMGGHLNQKQSNTNSWLNKYEQ